MNRNKWIIVSVVVIVILFIYLIMRQNSFGGVENKETAKEIVREEGIEINQVLSDSKKITNFIAHRLPEESPAIELEHSKHSHDVTNGDLLRNLFEQLFTGILAEDIDFVSVAFSPEALRSVLDDPDQINPEVMMEGIRNFNTVIGAEDTLQSIEYIITKTYSETEKDVMLTLKYTTGIEKQIPVKVSKIGDDGHAAYQITTPITEFLSHY